MKAVIVHPSMTSHISSDEVQIPINEIDRLENSSCVSIHLADCMDYVPLEERTKLLEKVCGKLRFGGQLTVSGVSIRSVARDIHYMVSTMEQLNATLYGGRLSTDLMDNTLRALREFDFDVVNCKIDGHYYSIKAQRKYESDE